jgi:hypothetical protein
MSLLWSRGPASPKKLVWCLRKEGGPNGDRAVEIQTPQIQRSEIGKGQVEAHGLVQCYPPGIPLVEMRAQSLDEVLAGHLLLLTRSEPAHDAQR